MMKQDTTYIM